MNNETTTTPTRGIRNCNPLNIRYNPRNKWKGRALIRTDETFEQFADMYFGFRAALIVLDRYIARHRCNTIADIVHRWAPPNENDTKGYINHVCRLTGIGGYEHIATTDRRLKEVVWAMAHIESGNDIEHYRAYLDDAWQDHRPTVKNLRYD